MGGVSFTLTGSVQAPAGPRYPNRCSNLPHTGQLLRRRKGWLSLFRLWRAALPLLLPQALQRGRLAGRGFRATMELGLLKLSQETTAAFLGGQTRSSSRPFPSGKRAGRNQGASSWMEANSSESDFFSQLRGRGPAPPPRWSL